MPRSARLLSLGSALLAAATLSASAADPIDRHALVTRHNPSAEKFDPLSPFTVGNGDFAFTADATGLQSFPEAYENGIPLHTMSDWGWHTMPNPQHYTAAEATRNYDVHGRPVPYLSGAGDHHDYVPAADWLRANPQRLDLARLGLTLRHADGKPVLALEITGIHQTLDLWSGTLDSRFVVDGQPVHVRTACDPRHATLAVEIDSPLLTAGRAGLSLAFPGASDDWKKAADWDHPDRYQTTATTKKNHCTIQSTLDATTCSTRLDWSGDASFKSDDAAHRYTLSPTGGKGADHLAVVCSFSPQPLDSTPPAAQDIFTAAAAHWESFWRTGGAVDLSGSTDPRWHELERRIVLSQYLTALNCAGTTPPQETGLTTNSWYGKFHLEMHWWHAAQFALWGHPELLEKSMAWYQTILPQARALARAQGYDGVRWPKMTDPSGTNSPSKVAAFLLWQQPHPIYLAELLRRAHAQEGDHATLEKYRDLVFQTADFMASFPAWDAAGKRYVLGPQIIPAQESWGKYRDQTLNPTYELAYWHWALETAQQWRTRLGLKRDPHWDDVLTHLAKPTVRDGRYAAVEAPALEITSDHPAVLAALGMVPATPLIDPATMRATLHAVLQQWDWPSTWGWDYPMIAMTATRLGEPDPALSALLMDTPKNTWLPNGHNYQEPRLPLYLPGNGALLTAIALMTAGWDHSPQTPGFPQNGQWKVRVEGVLPLP